MIIGKESEVIHGIGQKDDCQIFLLKAAEPSMPTFASTAVCQDTAKATDPTPADGVNIILTNGDLPVPLPLVALPLVALPLVALRLP
ncbi:hypothetical protein ACOMHN_024787 [Nucella lapillus]